MPDRAISCGDRAISRMPTLLSLPYAYALGASCALPRHNLSLPLSVFGCMCLWLTDAIVGRRSLEGGSDGAEAGGVQQRVLSTILNELDGIDSGLCSPLSFSCAFLCAFSLLRRCCVVAWLADRVSGQQASTLHPQQCQCLCT